MIQVSIDTDPKCQQSHHLSICQPTETLRIMSMQVSIGVFFADISGRIWSSVRGVSLFIFEELGNIILTYFRENLRVVSLRLVRSALFLTCKLEKIASCLPIAIYLRITKRGKQQVVCVLCRENKKNEKDKGEKCVAWVRCFECSFESI